MELDVAHDIGSDLLADIRNLKLDKMGEFGILRDQVVLVVTADDSGSIRAPIWAHWLKLVPQLTLCYALLARLLFDFSQEDAPVIFARRINSRLAATCRYSFAVLRFYLFERHLAQLELLLFVKSLSMVKLCVLL